MPSNSATPPVVRAVLDWFAITSTPLGTADSVSRVWGSAPVAVVTSWPRYPTTPGTPDQLSFTVIKPVFVQFCANGRDCGLVSAAAGNTLTSRTLRSTSPKACQPRLRSTVSPLMFDLAPKRAPGHPTALFGLVQFGQ